MIGSRFSITVFTGVWSAADAAARSVISIVLQHFGTTTSNWVAGALDIDPERGKAFGRELYIAEG